MSFNMSLRTDGSETPPSAERLAQALRSGLELRWSIPSLDLEASTCFPPNANVRPFLERHADLLHYSLPRRLHPLSRFVQGIRKVLRKFISPWLDVQTRFNLSAVSVLEQIEQRVQSLEQTERVLRQTIEALEKKQVAVEQQSEQVDEYAISLLTREKS